MTTTRPSRGPYRPRAAGGAAHLARLAARLTPRDRWLLRMLEEHRVLTTHQITRLAYTTHRSASRRLLALHHQRAIDRFRPYTHHGSAPWHYILDTPGAAVLAAEHDQTPAEHGYRHDRAIAIAHWPSLTHLIGVNDLLTTLAATARTSRGRYHLATWWSERRCARLWGRHARPDAYAHWRDTTTNTDFFLEYDTGTEPLARVTAKLHGYHALAAATGITTPVLFTFPTARREAAWRRHTATTLASLTHPAQVPIATTHTTDTEPHGPTWLPLRTTQPEQAPTPWPDTTAGRVRLADLATHLGTDEPASTIRTNPAEPDTAPHPAPPPDRCRS